MTTVQIRRSTVIDAPAAEVWRTMRDFNSHHGWHPAIAASRIEGGEPADEVGAVRAFRLPDGAFLREQLLALSDREMRLTYCLLEAPLALMDYVATVRLKPVTDGDRTFITWESRFSPPPGEADRLTRLVAADIYEAGFVALKELFERPAAPPGPAAIPRPPAPPAELAPAPVVAASPATVETEAILVERHGGPEVLVPRRVAVPAPGPGEVRLRHGAIGVNYIDVYCRTGFFRLLTPPGIPGMEGAGTVVDVGAEVRHLRVGDRVVYACEPLGAYAGIRTMPAALLVPLPPDISDETAAAIFLKGVSVEFLIHRVRPLKPGETVLVHAAAGGMGSLMVQWARAIGARVIGTVSTREKAERAMAAGADHVIVYSEEDFVDAVRRVTGGRGVDAVFDGVGRDTLDRSLEALAERGHLVSFGQASGRVGSVDVDALAAKSVTLSRPNFGHYTADPRTLREMAARLFDAVRTGVITPVIDSRFPLAEAAAAHRRLEARQNVGSVILVP